MTKQSLILRVGVALALFITLVVAIRFSSFEKYLNPDDLILSVRGLPDDGWVFLSLQGVYVIGSWVLFPLTATTVIALIIFPLWKAVTAAVIGIFLSSTVSYLVGRRGLPVSENPRFKKHLQLVEEEIESYGFWAIGAMRLGPQPPFVVTSVLAGALKVNYWKYLLATYIGLAPLMVLTFIFGQQTIEVIKDPSIIAMTTLLAMVVMIPIYIVLKKSYFKKRNLKKQNLKKQSRNTILV